MQTWSCLWDHAKLVTPLLSSDPADSLPEKSTAIRPRIVWIQLLFKYNKPCLEKWLCLICQRSYSSCRKIFLVTFFPQWIFVLPEVVRLCYWANPYSLFQDPLASSVSQFSFQMAIGTASMLMDPGTYQSSWVLIRFTHMWEQAAYWLLFCFHTGFHGKKNSVSGPPKDRCILSPIS